MAWYPSRRQLVCIAAVLAARGLDYVTTLGVLAAGGREANPVVARFIADFGPITGLAVAALVSVSVFALAIEQLLRTLDMTRFAPYTLHVRTASYGVLVVMSLAAALHNLT